MCYFRKSISRVKDILFLLMQQITQILTEIHVFYVYWWCETDIGQEEWHLTISKIKRCYATVYWAHCFLQRHVLCYKKLAVNLKMYVALRTIRRNERREQVTASEVRLLLLGEVMLWLPGITIPFWISIWFKNLFHGENISFSEFLQDKESLVSHLNDIGLQGHKKIILLITDRVNTVTKKLGFWIIRLKKHPFLFFFLLIILAKI